VFNTRQNRWSGHSDVIPGLNGTFGDRVFDEPFGRWNGKKKNICNAKEKCCFVAISI
jgi:hypothetical protein